MLCIICTCTSQLVKRPALCVLQRTFSSDGRDQISEIFRRLEALESRLDGGHTCLNAESVKDSHQPAPHGSQPGDDESFTEKAADKAVDIMDEAANDAVQKLHPALIKFLNRCGALHGGCHCCGSLHQMLYERLFKMLLTARNWVLKSYHAVVRSATICHSIK